VDAETGVRKELEPKDCEKCYTLEFISDSTATLWTTSNKGAVHLNGTPRVMSVWTEVGERGDGYLFVDVCYRVTSYARDGDELKFFYQADEKESYLLYKPVQP
jgi:hypothetical protein